MDFGDVLNQWDKTTAKAYGKKKLVKDERAVKNEEKSSDQPRQKTTDLPHAHPIDVWMRRHGIVNKDEREDDPALQTPAERRRKLHALKSEATIDLHGLTRDDAWMRLEAFFADCVRRGLRKVLIIHGKGMHSDDNPVLKKMVQVFIERNPHAGESGFSSKSEGGSGSTWVLLK